VLKSASLRLRDIRALSEMTHECRDRGDDPVAWRQHWFKRLAEFIDADLVVGGELAGLRSGRPRDLGTTAYGWENGFDPGGWARALELLQTDPDYSPILAEYGRRSAFADGEALRVTEIIPESSWRRSAEFQEVFRAIGVEYSLYCLRSIPGTADEVNGPVLMRAAGRRNFSRRHKELVREASAMIGPLVGGALARFAEPSPVALPVRVRQVLQCLLEGDGDKQIAARLYLSPYTVNEYAKRIFTHFGVVSRAELLARWVRRGWGTGGPGWVDAIGK